MRSWQSLRGAGRAFALLTALLASACQTGAGETSSDNPEPGRQGEILAGEAQVLPRPYSMGVRVVGHEPLSNRDTNVQMSWIDHCAYVASSQPNFLGMGLTAEPSTYGIAVIDVSNPRAPRQVGLLRDQGAIYAAETMHAVEAPDRRVLAAGAYGNGAAAGLHPGDPAWLDIYDASDCAHPRLMAEVSWPENAHTVAVSPNGRRVYGLHIEPFTGRGGIMVMDISDMAHPRYIGKFGATAPDGRSWEFAPHEMSISADERRLYVGVVGSRGGDLNRNITTEGFTPERVAPGAGGIYIFDNSDIVDDRADPKLRLVGTAEHGGWHSVMRANINGVPYLVGGGELTPCPGAYPQLVNIADETHPFIAGAFQLAMNHAENCASPGAPIADTVGGIPSATLHFNDVDSADHTRLGLFNFTYAGLRIADLRDPAHPVEVAYFRPGDWCTGHVRYVPETGHIWSVCGSSGFWVTELSPSVRASLRR